MLTSSDFKARDIYLDYPFERAKFRWDHDQHQIHRRFYGEKEAVVEGSDELFNEAIRSGSEITRDEYYRDEYHPG